ncbi:MAG: DUF4116 domain-containing protein [Parasporobacterium sp.]|nr:DUF4116 domain-containing protein [Parasporobacterium sp.]
MSRKTREEIIAEYKDRGWLNSRCLSFYQLNHDEKADPKVFEEFCALESGHMGIVLSDDEICANKELVKIARKHGFFGDYHLLSEQLLNDPEMALLLAECNRYEYTKISKDLRDNAELMLKAVRINPGIYISLTAKVKANREIVLEIAKRDPYQLSALLNVRKELREPLLHDKEIAMLVAKKSPESLYEFFPHEFFFDYEILESAFCLPDIEECKKRLAKYHWGIQFVEPKYWENDKKLIRQVLREDGALLQFLPEKYKSDKTYVLIAIKSDPNAIKYCSEELRDNEDIIKAALQEDSEDILSFASDRLRDDYDIVLKAVKVDALNLQYASDRLRDNKDIVLRALKTYGGVLEDASERLQNDEELIRIAEQNS